MSTPTFPGSPVDLDFFLLQCVRSGGVHKNAAVLLRHGQSQTLWMRFPEDWRSFDEEESDIITSLSSDLYSQSDRMGASELLKYLQSRLPGNLKLSASTVTGVADPEAELTKLFQQYVENG